MSDVRVRTWRMSVLLLIVALAVTACSGELLPDPTAPESPDTTAAETPEETTPPETTPPETSPPETSPPDTTVPEESGDVPIWVWILLGILVVGLVAWIGARSGAKPDAPPPVVAAPPSQPDTAAIARTAYADSRWLYDQLTPSLAVWKGDSQHQIQSGAGTPMSDRNAVWAEADTRLKSARDALYNVESANPSAPIAVASQDLVNSLNSVREGVDRLAAARLATLSGSGSSESEAAATDDLAARRSSLQASLTRFSEHL